MDKRISLGQLRLLRIDVVSGAVLTGVISFFVVVACATALHREGIRIDDASAAARALEPLAGQLAAELLAVGLVGAALLSASVLPLSTACSVCDVAGRPTALFDTVREAPLSYGTFGVATVVRVALVLHILTALRAVLRDPPNATCRPVASRQRPRPTTTMGALPPVHGGSSEAMPEPADSPDRLKAWRWLLMLPPLSGSPRSGVASAVHAER